jgi:hypothetical protein
MLVLLNHARLVALTLLASVFLMAPSQYAQSQYAQSQCAQSQCAQSQCAPHPWPHSEPVERTLESAFPAPAGFQRAPAEKGSFAAWLRVLPLKQDGAPVKLYDGRMKGNQDVHAAVIDMDVGTQDLQQCADAIMRLRAEYLLSSGREADIGFNNTEGKRMAWPAWKQRHGGASNYTNFRKYLIQIFAYAGTYSLERELAPEPVAQMQIGDVFIRGGFPGHAELVADMVENPATGERRFLLLQSFMPAQDIHVLKNPQHKGDPWYPLNFGETLLTPEYSFSPANLRRFR